MSRRLDEIMSAAKASRMARDNLMSSTPRPLVLPRRNLGPVLVSRCPTEPNRWRATFFFADGEPSGHVVLDTFAEAVAEAVRAGGVPTEARDA